MKSFFASCAASLLAAFVTCVALTEEANTKLTQLTGYQIIIKPVDAGRDQSLAFASEKITPASGQPVQQADTKPAQPVVAPSSEPPAAKQPEIRQGEQKAPVNIVEPAPKPAQETKAPAVTASGDAGRRTPLVETVAKTMPGVVSIRVQRSGEKDMIGSGFVVDERGLIITNNHVTGGKKFVKVRLHDGTDLHGEVIAKEAECDLAVIRVKAKEKLHVLKFSVDHILGETAIAIGAPYGYERTVSQGIVSALNREITMPNDIVISGLIQTDAAINPGNSGGPLLNINGEAIGVIVALRDSANSIAFAINASTAKSFLNRHVSVNQGAGQASLSVGAPADETAINTRAANQR